MRALLETVWSCTVSVHEAFLHLPFTVGVSLIWNSLVPSKKIWNSLGVSQSTAMTFSKPRVMVLQGLINRVHCFVELDGKVHQVQLSNLAVQIAMHVLNTI
jgi:hypothetical protein